MSLNKVLINTNQVVEFPKISYIDNPEFVFIKTDSENKILYGVKQDGEFFFGAGCPHQVRDYVEQKLAELSLDEYEDIVAFLNDYLGSDTTLKTMIDSINSQIATKLDAEGLDSDALETLQIVENPEYIEAKTDSEGKIISYRDSDGVEHEEIGINSKNIHGKTISADFFDYTDKNIVELMLRLIVEDFSCSYDLKLPRIYVTSDLLIVDGNNIIGLDISKNEVACTYRFVSTELSFIDNGTIAYQGNSTLMDDKKGFSMVLSNKHRFKDWIEMDEYRLKGYGQDWTSGKDVICNRLYDQILNSRGFETNKPWKKYNDFSSDSIRNLMSADKKCHMDGFPVELYINGSYWGIYVVCIRKERDNYNLDKKDKKHIQIEGEGLYADSRFSWTNIEIRNPKGYDEYVEPEDGDPIKDFITNWFNGISSITTDTSQAELEEYIDCQNFIDWYLHNTLIGNGDVISKNTELTTWDRKHMTFIPQDLNAAIGIEINEDELALAAYNHCSWLQTAIVILDTPIKNRYAELRKSVFTIDNITKLWEDWGREIGTDAYEADEKRWNRGRVSYDSILTWFNGRIGFLDSKFGYNQ